MALNGTLKSFREHTAYFNLNVGSHLKLLHRPPFVVFSVACAVVSLALF